MNYPLSLLLMLVACALISCTAEETPHPMVGVWQIEQIFQEGEALPLDNCDLLTTSDFRSNGVFFEKRHSKRYIGCSLNNKSGTWTETSTNVLRITYDNGSADFQNIKFIVSDTKMTLTDGDGSESFSIVFKKVE